MVSYSKHTDEELILLLKLDDTRALEELHNRYYGPLYVHAYKRFPFRDEIRDILQDLFTYLWINRSAISLSSGVQAYLYVAVRNRLFKLYRHHKVKNSYIDSLQGFIDQDKGTADDLLLEKEMAALIAKEIALLPTQMRLVFELSRNQELSHKEIAEKLGISLHTVRTHVQRALRILRAKLGVYLVLVLF